MNISDRIKDEIKTNLQCYLEEQGITIKRGRCRCPVHMGDCKTTAEINTRTGIIHGLPTLLHCPKCDKTWDVISLHAELNGLDEKRDFVAICQELADRFHINIDEGNKQSRYTRRVDAVPVEAINEKKYQELKERAKAYLAECATQLDEAESYLKSRGISIETARRCGIGYDDGYLIIPSGDGYNKRNMAPDCDKKDRYRKATGLKTNGFGWNKLEPGAVCWVVEGEIDALSLFEVGQIAAGLGGKDNVDSFCKDLEARPDFSTNPPKLILALDADDEGQKAQDKLEAWLKEKGTPYAVLDGTWKAFSENDKTKDANDALKSMGLEAFKAAANNEVSEFKDQKQRAAARYLESNIAGRLSQFWKDAQNADSPKPTGFKEIDKILGGGLRPGLYVCGAIPSLGKTALILQIANNLAKSGFDVLYFSLEMPVCDLVWRSVSCLSYIKDKEHALSQRELQFKKWDELGPKHDNALNAYDEYARTSAKYMWIYENIGGLNVDELEAAIANHKAMRGCAPVVVVDYLQIMQPHEPHMTDKAALDYNALRLKQIANRYQTTMLIISSFNRVGYGKDAGFESFKESGAIEYCSDCLFALQFKEMVDAIECASSKDADKAGRDATKAAKAKETREIELVVLKNRMGPLTDKRGINMSFVPKYNYFACSDEYFD